MKSRLITFILMALALSTPVHADRFERLFPESFPVGGADLVRKGVSQLTVGYIFRVYVAAFYQLPDQGPNDVLGDYPRHLEIEYLRGISRSAFMDAAEDMLARQHPPEVIEAIRPQIEAINRLYTDVRKGDRYALTYLPGRGTELFFNGESQGVIPGEEFARVYFSIWLGERHPYQEFRDRLVGLRR
ncbi:MAG TPA: chalcone isomerase family protein [Kiritimatiellia bacterium]|nr:chalcone isomerase family protein [Kiritimatiellia bacterium]HMP00555.1 chalcone isomerase family protein [Kiritimatiellia bacterium]